MDLTNTEVSDNGPASHLDGVDQETSPTRGPPSDTSSQEWDKVTDPGSNTPI
jgi:import receptor subunit TOM20